MQDKEFFEKYLSGLVGEVFGEELMDKTKPDYYMVNFLRDDVLDEDGAVVEEAPKVQTTFGSRNARKYRRFCRLAGEGRHLLRCILAPSAYRSMEFLSVIQDIKMVREASFILRSP